MNNKNEGVSDVELSNITNHNQTQNNKEDIRGIKKELRLYRWVLGLFSSIAIASVGLGTYVQTRLSVVDKLENGYQTQIKDILILESRIKVLESLSGVISDKIDFSKITNVKIQNNMMDENSINGNKFIDGTIHLNKIIGTTSGKIQSNQISSVDAFQITGQITNNQILMLNSDKLNGQINDNQISSLSSIKIQGQLTDNQISSMSSWKLINKINSTQLEYVSSNIIQGLITDAQISEVSVKKIRNLSDIINTTNLITRSEFQNINFSMVKGVIADSQLTSMNSSKLFDTIPSQIIPTITTEKISGIIGDSQIMNISYDKIFGKPDKINITDSIGQLSSPQIPTLQISKINQSELILLIKNTTTNVNSKIYEMSDYVIFQDDLNRNLSRLFVHRVNTYRQNYCSSTLSSRSRSSSQLNCGSMIIYNTSFVKMNFALAPDNLSDFCRCKIDGTYIMGKNSVVPGNAAAVVSYFDETVILTTGNHQLVCDCFLSDGSVSQFSAYYGYYINPYILIFDLDVLV